MISPRFCKSWEEQDALAWLVVSRLTFYFPSHWTPHLWAAGDSGKCSSVLWLLPLCPDKDTAFLLFPLLPSICRASYAAVGSLNFFAVKTKPCNFSSFHLLNEENLLPGVQFLNFSGFILVTDLKFADFVRGNEYIGGEIGLFIPSFGDEGAMIQRNAISNSSNEAGILSPSFKTKQGQGLCLPLGLEVLCWNSTKQRNIDSWVLGLHVQESTPPSDVFLPKN